MAYTLLKKIAQLDKVPLCIYQGETRIFQWPEEFQSVFDQNTELLSQLHVVVQKIKTPILYYDTVDIYYGAVHSDDWIILCGPCCPGEVTETLKARYRMKYDFAEMPVIQHLSLNRFSRLLSLIGYVMSGDDIPPQEIHLVNVQQEIMSWDRGGEMESYLLDQSEYNRDHSSAEYEQKLLHIVRTGNVEAMKELVTGSETLDAEHIGILSQDGRKQVEYMCVALLTLLPRAAVEGGVATEKAFSMADVFMQRLGRCHSTEQMLGLTARAQVEFTEAVQEYKQRSSNISYIEEAKAFIAQNLRKPFQVSEIAPAIGVNRSYLTRKFSETEGITIQQYITKERCEHAANLLRHTDYPISLIAEYFCFSSQSHFGRAFKEVYQMTPKEYRNLKKQK